MSGGLRNQNTIETTAEISGVGFFTGVDVTVRFVPAVENHGVVFQRIDLADQPTVAADISNVVPAQRRTTLQCGDATVQLVEHIMAALAGLQIDNVLVEIDAPESPGLDGSCKGSCEALMEAGICEQTEPVTVFMTHRPWSHIDRGAGSEVAVRPHIRRLMAITYQLDYGHKSPVRPQLFSIELTPESFFREIAWARTFVLESEVRQLKRAGYGSRVTEKDLLVFAQDGSVLGNQLRSPDECVRHKILDCVGDFALCGGSICGHFNAWRSGHNHNHLVIRHLDEYSCPITTRVSAA